jgi:hypothetical protein
VASHQPKIEGKMKSKIAPGDWKSIGEVIAREIASKIVIRVNGSKAAEAEAQKPND